MGIRLTLYISDRAATDVDLFQWIRSVRKSERQQTVKNVLAEAVAQNPERFMPLPRKTAKGAVTPSGIRPEPPHSHPQDQPPSPLPMPTVPSLAGLARDMKRAQDPSRRQ